MSELPAVPAHIPVPAAAEISSGIWSLPVPLPSNPRRYVVPYALEVPGGRVLIDAGWNDEEPWNALVDGLSSMGATPHDVRGVPVSMLLAGLPDRELTHGQVVPDVPGFELTAIHTPGHTDGHVCLLDRDRDVLFSGDHVLAKISPNVSTMTSLLDNPLGAYLDSLRSTGDLGIDAALPAHVEPIGKLRERAAELLSHHEQRLAEMLDTLTVESALTAFDVARRQPWKRGWAGLTNGMRRAAVGETHAHLIELATRGLVVQDADGPVVRWSARGEGDRG